METSESESSESFERREDRKKPEIAWLKEFIKYLRHGFNSSEICVFDRATKDLIGLIRTEIPTILNKQLRCRSFVLVKRVQFWMCFFANLFQDASEILDDSVFNVRMMELLPLYLDLELVSFGLKVYSPIETAERIATVIDIFLNCNRLQACEILLHITTYWIPPLFKRIKDLLVCLFKKLLSHTVKTADEVEYVQYILLYRLWMIIAREGEEIIEIQRHCLSHLTISNNLRITRTMTQLFPPGMPLRSIQMMLIVDIDVFPVTQAFLNHMVTLRNNSILGIDLTPDLLEPINNGNTEEICMEIQAVGVCFEEFTSNVSEGFKHSSEIQPGSINEIRNRLLVNPALNVSSGRDHMMDDHSRQRLLLLSRRRERAEARRRQEQLERKRLREEEKHRLLIHEQLVSILSRNRQPYFPPMVKAEEVICLDSDSDEEVEKPPVVNSNVPVNPSMFFDMSENGPLRQFVVDIINNTTSTFINETRKQLGMLAFPEQLIQKCLETSTARSNETVSKSLQNFDKILTGVAQNTTESLIGSDKQETGASCSSSHVNKLSSSTLPNKASSDNSSKSDSNVSISLDNSSKTSESSSTENNSSSELTKTIPTIVKETQVEVDETVRVDEITNHVEATSTQEERIVEAMSKTTEEESNTTSPPMLTVNTELEQAENADSSQITPVIPDSSKPVITTPELINTCMSILSKDQTSKSTALVTPSQTSNLLISVGCDTSDGSLGVSDETLSQNNKDKKDESAESNLSISTTLFDVRDDSDELENTNNDNIVSEPSLSLPRIVDCYSLKTLEVNTLESTTLREDVTLNVSPSPKTYIDKGKEGKKSWRDNRVHGDKRNKSLSPIKKVSFPETNSDGFQPRRRNSFMTPAQLKCMSNEKDDSDMEIDECVAPSRELTVKDSPEEKDKANKTTSEDNSQTLNCDSILSPISPAPETPEVTKSILKRRPVKKASPSAGESLSLSAERSILKTSKTNKSKSKNSVNSSHYLVRRSESPSSSQEVKNKHVPVANVVPQYKQVHFPSDVNDNAPTSRTIRMHKEEKASDIQFRLTFYKPDNPPSTSKNRFITNRRDQQQLSTSSAVNQHLQSTPNSSSRSASPIRNSTTVRSPDSFASTRKFQDGDAKSTSDISVSNAMMTFASRCISGEHIPVSTLKNIVMLAVAEESTPPPAHMRSHRRPLYRRNNQVNANIGSYYATNSRLSHRSHSCDSHFDDEPAIISQQSRNSMKINTQPRSKSATRAGRGAKTSPNRNTVKRRTRIRTPAPVQENSTRMFLYIAPFCDKYGTQTKVSFYVDNPEVNYSELYNVGNQDNPAVVLEDIWDKIPSDVIAKHKVRQSTRRPTRANTPRRANYVTRRKGRAKKEPEEWSTPKQSNIEEVTTIDPKKIDFNEEVAPAPVEKKSSSPPRQKASLLLRKRPTEKVTIDETVETTSTEQRQRTFLTVNTADVDEEDLFLQDPDDNYGSDDSDQEAPMDELGTQRDEMRRSFEDFFTEFKRRDSFDSDEKRSFNSRDSDYPMTQDDMINKTTSEKNIITRLRRRASRVSSLPSTSKQFTKHIVGDEIDDESRDSFIDNSDDDDEKCDSSSSSESSSSSSSSDSSSDESSDDDSSTVSSPTSKRVVEEELVLAPEDILRVVTGDALPPSIVTPASETEAVKKDVVVEKSVVSEEVKEVSRENGDKTEKRLVESVKDMPNNIGPVETDKSDDDSDRLMIDESPDKKKSRKLPRNSKKSIKKLVNLESIENEKRDSNINENENFISRLELKKISEEPVEQNIAEEIKEIVEDKKMNNASDDNLKSENEETSLSKSKIIEINEKSSLSKSNVGETNSTNQIVACSETNERVAKTYEVFKCTELSEEYPSDSDKKLTKDKTSSAAASSDEDVRTSSDSDSKSMKRQIADLQSAALILDFWRTGDKIAERKITNTRSVASLVETTPPVISKRTSTVVDLPVEKIFYSATRKDYSKTDAERDLFKIVQKEEVSSKNKISDEVVKDDMKLAEVEVVKPVQINDGGALETMVDEAVKPEQNKEIIEDSKTEETIVNVEKSLNETPSLDSSMQIDRDKGTPDLYNVSTLDLNSPIKKIDETIKEKEKEKVNINEIKKDIFINKNDVTPPAKIDLFDLKNKEIKKTNKILYVVRGNTQHKISNAKPDIKTISGDLFVKSKEILPESKTIVNHNTKLPLESIEKSSQKKLGRRMTRSNVVQEESEVKSKSADKSSKTEPNITLEPTKIINEDRKNICDENNAFVEEPKLGFNPIVIPDTVMECEVETTINIVGAVEEVVTDSSSVKLNHVAEDTKLESDDDKKQVELNIVDTPVVSNEEVVTESKTKRSTKNRSTKIDLIEIDVKKATRSRSQNFNLTQNVVKETNTSQISKVKLIPDLMPINKKKESEVKSSKVIKTSEVNVNKVEVSTSDNVLLDKKAKDAKPTEDKKIDLPISVEPVTKENKKSGELGMIVKTPGQLKYIPPLATDLSSDEKSWNKIENILGNNNESSKKMDDYKIPKKRSRTILNDDDSNDINATQSNKVSEGKGKMDRRHTKRNARQVVEETKLDADVPVVSSTTNDGLLKSRNVAKRTIPSVFIIEECLNNPLMNACLPKLYLRKCISIPISRLTVDDVDKRKIKNIIIDSAKRKNSIKNGPIVQEKKSRPIKKRTEQARSPSPRRKSSPNRKKTPSKPAGNKRRLGMSVVISNTNTKKRKTDAEVITLNHLPVCGDSTPVSKRRSNRRKSVVTLVEDSAQVEAKYPEAPGAATELMYPSDDSLGSEYFKQQYNTDDCNDFRDDSSPEPLIVEIEEVQVTSSVDNLTLNNPPEYSADELKQHFFS